MIEQITPQENIIWKVEFYRTTEQISLKSLPKGKDFAR